MSEPLALLYIFFLMSIASISSISHIFALLVAKLNSAYLRTNDFR